MRKKDKTSGGAFPIIGPKEKSTIHFLPPKIGIKMTGEAKGQYLEVDLEDFFERVNRQGWAGVKIKKL